MKKMRTVFSVLVSTLPALLAGCMQQKASVTMLQAPEVADAAKYKSMAVARFGGQHGEGLSQSLEAVLTNAKVQDKAVYRSVVRGGDSRSKGEDVKALAAAARSQGAEAVFIGEVTRADVKDTRSSQKHFVCDKTEKGKLIGKCLSGHDETITCIERTAVMQAQVKLIDAQGGNTVYSEVIEKSDTNKACGQEQPTDGKTMLATLQGQIVDQVKRKVVPHEAMVSIQLMEADEAIRPDAARETFAGAVKFAMAGRMDRACEMFKQLGDTEKNSVALNYNLGVCEEAAGAFWRASEYFAIADKLTKEPNPLLNRAMARNEANIKKSGKLAQNRSDLVSSSTIESGAAPQTMAAATASAPASSTTTAAPRDVSADMLLLEKRTALVIGNSTYDKNALRNPVNDARAMAKALRQANFQVIAVENADHARMNAAIDEFGRAIKQGGVALFFYAGHGMQSGGENYLVPVKIDVKAESELPYKTVNLGYILAKLDEAKPRVNIVVLDACRDNPFARSWRSGKTGLASIDAPAGTVIAFATAPGKTAADGAGNNGLFTTHFLKQMAEPNLKIEDVLKNTRKAVAGASRNEQVPWDSSSLTGDFYFKVSK